MPFNLPNDFKIGISESDLQSVGSEKPYALENAHQSLWVPFSEKQGKKAPYNGSFKYDRVEEDVELLKESGISTYRTSVSMCRTTTRDGEVNTKAIEWYRDYFQRIKDAGMELHICMYHWEVPEQFGDEGVLHPDFPAFFKQHVEIVLENFADLADYFIPVNETWCVSFLSYYIGIHAPGKKDIKEFFAAFFRMIELQAWSVRKIKEHDPSLKVGLVNIHFPAYTRPEFADDPEHQKARFIAQHLTNYMYSDPFYFGKLNEQFVAEFEEQFPANYKEIVANAKMGELIDYYAANYYTGMYVVPADNPIKYDQFVPEGAPRNQLDWPIAIPPHYPNALTEMLLDFTERYKDHGLKELMITENGIPGTIEADENGQQQDDFRIEFLTAHLEQISEAIKQGAPVAGYLMWSLIDNFEWQESYRPEGAFGIVAVDDETGERKPKKSYEWFKSINNQ